MAAYTVRNTLPRTGTLYVCPVSLPTPEEDQLAASAGRAWSVLGYSIRVDSIMAQSISADSARVFSGLDRGTKHLLKVYHSGKRLESFWFDFTKADADTLCLGMNLSYRTWQLEKSTTHGCGCRWR